MEKILTHLGLDQITALIPLRSANAADQRPTDTAAGQFTPPRPCSSATVKYPG